MMGSQTAGEPAIVHYFKQLVLVAMLVEGSHWAGLKSWNESYLIGS